MLVTLGKRPLLRLSSANQQNGVEGTDTDAAIDFFSVCFITTERLGEGGGRGRIHAERMCLVVPYGERRLNFMRVL